MEVQKVTKELEANIQALAERKTKREDELSKINANIKQLRQDKKAAIQDISILYGAIQAYQGSVQIVGKEDVATDGVSSDG